MAKVPQCLTLVHSDVISLVAPNLVLRVVLARMMNIAFVIHVARMHLHDMAADSASFGIPTHVIADFECLPHNRCYCRSQPYAFLAGFGIQLINGASALPLVISIEVSSDRFRRSDRVPLNVQFASCANRIPFASLHSIRNISKTTRPDSPKNCCAVVKGNSSLSH